MMTAEITNFVSRLNLGDRAELVGILVDSFEQNDDEESSEDSLTIALRRSVEMKSNEDPGITVEELWASVQADRVKK